ncbi:hypothetical protein GGS21DRAFT_491742 [Xylaria nigripes]|nr:hypothetical protein GGS21DRAFT_491742 [Xylaria nigripes]
MRPLQHRRLFTPYVSHRFGYYTSHWLRSLPQGHPADGVGMPEAQSIILIVTVIIMAIIIPRVFPYGKRSTSVTDTPGGNFGPDLLSVNLRRKYYTG